MMIYSVTLAIVTIVCIFLMYEMFNLIQIPPEEDGDEEAERQAIVASMSRQHLR